jgi:glutamine cyclotransferase
VTTAIPTYRYTIAVTYPHDANAFTQGLQYADGFLYEGTGLHGRSSLRKVNLETGAVLQKRDLPAEYFGEGITLWKSMIVQLTWQSGIAFAYDAATFAPLRTFTYKGEGWGLTHDETDLIMSDGTSDLRFLAPETFIERRRVRVTAAGKPVDDLNELEFVNGEIFANIWQTDRIARIDPKSGNVSGWIDLTGLLPQRDRTTSDAVLNGIAYDASRSRLFVTGKLWPKLFEIKIKPH